MRIVVALALCAIPALVSAQSPYISVIGTVDKVDATAKVLTVKPDKGDNTTVKYDDKTVVMLLPAGETDTKKATPSDAAQVAAGDRVVARVLTADPTGKPARTLYLTKQADAAKRLQQSEEEWKNAVTGLVTSIDAAAHQIKFTARVPGSPAPKEIPVDLSGTVDYRRYDPDNGKYETSNLSAIKVGDQVRVLGAHDTDFTGIKAERIGSGSFKTIGVQVKTIDPAAKVITGIETGSKAPVTIALRSDTSLKKFTDMAAMSVARQLNPTYQQAGGARGAGRGAGAPGGGRGGRVADVGKIIEQQPSIELTDLKPGDAVIVTVAMANDPSKMTATALVAGVEPILRAAPNNGSDPLAGSWESGAGGGGGQ